MATTKGKRIISAGWKKKSMSISKKKIGMKENRLNRIGIVLSSDIARTKV
jgi:hypothetical protein